MELPLDQRWGDLHNVVDVSRNRTLAGVVLTDGLSPRFGDDIVFRMVGRLLTKLFSSRIASFRQRTCI